MNLEIDSHSHYVKAAALEDIPESDCYVVYLEGKHVLIAAGYLVAHAPTARAQGQTYNIAERLYHGDRLFESV